MRSGPFIVISLLAVLWLLVSEAPQALAGWADTLPKHGMIVETSFSENIIATQFDSHGQDEPLADFDMYAPTGEYLGTIVAPARATTRSWVTKVALGLTDRFTMALIFPVLTGRRVQLNLDWTEGDFSNELGRPYSEDDFWQWANSMGQPTPEDWEGPAALSDIVVGGFYNFVNHKNLTFTVLGIVNTRTGEDRDPEVLGAYGTTLYELGFAGDLGAHALFDFKFPGTLFARTTFSAELFYEYLFERSYRASTGKINPLVTNDAPYTGDSYRVKPGDYYGYGVGVDFCLIRGRRTPTWLTRADPEFQGILPALLNMGFAFHNFFAFPSNFHSQSTQWDDEQEADGLNKALRKCTLSAKATLSLLRYGCPLDLFVKYTDQELIKGKNFRPITGWEFGLRIYYSFDAYNPLITLRDRFITPMKLFF